ncbi:serine/threonine-protein kinase [Catellatospora bangladeshensis]|uniref:serine/threonine-protein kinase n=1 Tax=Catellatospora bangladeshensis TaxID=310355 RepID=UPI00360B04AC
MTKTTTSGHWRPGRLLDDRYRLLDPVGTGGSASVWRARDERLGRIVAVKLLDPRLLTDELALRRLRDEAQALARLRHPHIAEVYDYGVTGTRRPNAAYLAMELVDGQSLNQILGEQIYLDWPVAVTVAAQVAAALVAAHARGIVHRDLAPSNVLLAADGAKVIDFGICAPQEPTTSTRADIWPGPRVPGPGTARRPAAPGTPDRRRLRPRGAAVPDAVR